ncbi:unnamed protein product [Leptosia nina]|uniref:Nose resistant-to-fluoxetine protein N-terminal domain-containing protein n=1 Tax=Leptosia nina TaxID=320188 RepID=A0AAV1JQ28_9NEOP
MIITSRMNVSQSKMTVSAFRVRLAHERASGKHSESCDSNELNLDQKQSKLSSKRAYDGLKKIVQEKLKDDGKLNADDLIYLHGLSDKKFNAKTKIKIDDNILEKHEKVKQIPSKIENTVLKFTTSAVTKSAIIQKTKDDDSDDDDDDEDIPSDKDTEFEENGLDDVDIQDENGDSDNKSEDDNNEEEERDSKKNDSDEESDENEEEIVIEIKAVPKTGKASTPISIQKFNKEENKDDPIPQKVTLKTKVENKDPVKDLKSSTPIKRPNDMKDKKAEKIEDDIQKQEAKTTPKIDKPTDVLEKIKVKSHIEAGKLQSHLISKDQEKILPPKDEIKIEKTLKKDSESLQASKDSKVKGKKSDKIKQLPDASHTKILLQSEFEDFYGFFPTFAPNFSRVHNPECRRHGQILLRQLRGTKLWALNMLDSTAKIPSGLLQGNGIQLGDFDQCLASRARVQLETGSIVKVQGKYCLATMDVKAETPDLEVAVDFLQGRNLIKGRVSDPGHFVPRFSTLSWGVCVPSPCSPKDVEVIITEATKQYQRIGVTLNVEVDELDCHVQQKGSWWEGWMEIPTLLTLSFYAAILCLVLIATCQDLLAENRGSVEECSPDEKQDTNGSKPRSDGFISAFSLTRTLKKLVAPAGADEIPSIHGLRAIATIFLIAAHKFLPIAHIPYTNRIKLAEVVSSPIWSWCRVGWVMTDCFLLLSGTLTAYRTSDKTSAFNKLASRYLRLTPALLAVIWFYAYIWDNISFGPRWGGLVTKNAEICREGWWWNMFYLQNYFGLENMCAPQTHQLALDMQLTIVGSFLVWAIQADVVGSRLAMPLIHLYAAYSRYATFRDHRLTMIAYHGVSVSQLYRTGRMSYTSILHRSTSYLVGISLGLALRNTAQYGKLLIFTGWVLSAGLWGSVLWAGYDSGFLNYQYNVTFAALYAAGAPVATALAFAWLLYAAHNGYSDTLSSLLCSRPLLIISRLSYAIYLTQFIVFLTNAATVKTSTEFTLLSVIDFQEISAIFLSGVLLTLTLVFPMQALPNILFKERKEEHPVEELENKIENEETEPQVETKPTLRKPLLAHRELLEEIPETEIEYEAQRDNQSLEEILEEDDDNLEDDRIDDDELEVIEEEEEEEKTCEEDFWAQQDMNPEKPDHDLDEWEWTNGNRGGAQYYRYSR